MSIVTYPCPTDASARVLAIARIKTEHRALSYVMRALRKAADEIARGSIEPDWRLLAAMLYYIDSFPERFHHPKEDEHLFRALRRRTSRADAALDALQAEHIRSAQLAAYLDQRLVHYQGGARDGLKNFRDAVNAYVALQDEHMRKEENEVLPLAEEFLKDEDWRAIDEAFRANEDPLFGAKQQHEFHALYRRITGLVPRQLKSLLSDERR